MSAPNDSRNQSRAFLLSKQITRDWWWVTISLILLSVLLSLFNEKSSLRRIDLAFYDYVFNYSVSPSPPSNTAIIMIDDRSINEIGYWPWRRIEYAHVLNYLRLAKAVGIDIIFNDQNPAFPDDNFFLAYSIASNGRVVLPSVIDNKTLLPTYPIEPIGSAAAQVGFINAYPDQDGVVRRTFPYKIIDSNRLDHFAVAMLYAANEESRAQYLFEKPPKSYLIPFRGPPGSFQTYSFSDVLNGLYSPNEFKDRYVLIGAWSQGLGDFYPTPMSTNQQTSMSGVEILANNLESVLNNHWISKLPTFLNALISALPVLLTCIILRRLTPRQAILSTFGMLLITLISNWFILNFFRVWIPPTPGFIATALAYPIWYWRSQETVLQFINNEITQMRNNDPALRQSLSFSANEYTLPGRLSQLHLAIELLRDAQRRKEETLRFISHDMRAPQNSILALVKMTRENQLSLSLEQMLNRVESYVETTLDLVDDFMDLARVEAMEIELDAVSLNDLLAEVCDNAWVRGQAKKIQISFVEPEYLIWVQAHPALLKRALTNLVDNAIKYSSENTTISCSCHIDTTTNLASIIISDQGWGIPVDHLATIFQAFKRAHEEKENAPKGSGLGLAFVEMVILRHFGSIQVESKVNVGTTFTIQLPLVTGAE